MSPNSVSLEAKYVEWGEWTGKAGGTGSGFFELQIEACQNLCFPIQGIRNPKLLRFYLHGGNTYYYLFQCDSDS